MFDYQKAWMLLEVVHKAAAAGPAYSWLLDLANAELMSMKAPQPAPDALAKAKADLGITEEVHHD
jgi:hypothetical protein